jgi:hypothetical protein
VFVPACALNGSWRIAPGDSLLIPVQVVGFTAQNMSPHLDARLVAGRYRLLFGVSVGDSSGALMTNVSTPPIASSMFVVRDEIARH